MKPAWYTFIHWKLANDTKNMTRHTMVWEISMWQKNQKNYFISYINIGGFQRPQMKKKINKNHHFNIWFLACSQKIKKRLKICILYLVSSQIWLNFLRDDNINKNSLKRTMTITYIVYLSAPSLFKVKPFITETPHMHHTPKF